MAGDARLPAGCPTGAFGSVPSAARRFSVLVGSIVERSQVPLSKWLMALHMMSASKNGVAAFEFHRALGVTNNTPWFMPHRICEAMKRGTLAEPMTGTIVADETWIGGKASNRHQPRTSTTPVPVVAGEAHTKRTDKTSVLSLVNTTTGEVRSRVVPDVSGPTLRKAIADQVHMGQSHTYKRTGGGAICQVGAEFATHQSVNHDAGEYVRDDVTTNQAEGYFSQLKRSIDGTPPRQPRAPAAILWPSSTSGSPPVRSPISHAWSGSSRRLADGG